MSPLLSSGKLDSLKRAVDLMEESTTKLTDLTLKIDSTEGRIALTQTTISSYPNVKRAHFARDNINKVISEVGSWRLPVASSLVMHAPALSFI